LTAALEKEGNVMQATGGAAVAALILFCADQLLNDGLYSSVADDMLRHLCGLIGIHI
jgi:hypothetical protein